ncbi:hypothetical protein MVEN_01330500 [Mycena venus]|uniref:DUF6535 domain-containing protein n=1 Tax=Mycena venus TaxID=2733690 RepID=A0A8H6Y134_9AGAR|nr:hypothetical protein MVEN_01330500 [Mycena venus]
MDDNEKVNGADHRAMDLGNEAATAKLWAVYISEAEKYDKSLVESWKSDMEGMLIFAGLFSASLTAFLIESYKTLNPDPNDSTNMLLNQISQQLAAASNGTPFQIAQSTPKFSAPATSIICNALWFTSLGLSLTCALIATLLEQWARDFIHRADMRSAPVIRARIFSYLYYGLKRFNMHAVVDIIPLLLHASLLFFLAGLVAFLIPVNSTMTAIAGANLLIVAAIYSILTILPLYYLDCPYRTPLSGAFWRLWRKVERIFSRAVSANSSEGESVPFHEETVVEVMSRSAMTNSEARDYRALVWTVKSLADDMELEPFVEAIPDALWRPNLQITYARHVRGLLEDRGVQLLFRVKGLCDSCSTGLLPPDLGKRRLLACYKALWAISSLSQIPVSSTARLPPVDFSPFTTLYHTGRMQDADLAHHSASTRALMRWSTFCAVDSHLAAHIAYLSRRHLNHSEQQDVDLGRITSFLRKYRHTLSAGAMPSFTMPTASVIGELIRILKDIRTNTPYRILFMYLSESACLDSLPYEWAETRRMLQPDPSIPLVGVQNDLTTALTEAIYDNLHRIIGDPDVHWVDATISDLCSLWRPEHTSSIPCAIVHYLNHRKSDRALNRVVWESGIGVYLWSCFPTTISQGPSLSRSNTTSVRPDEVLTSLWVLASLHHVDHSPRASLYARVLEAVSMRGLSRTSISIAAVVKKRILEELSLNLFVNADATVGEVIRSFTRGLFPVDTAIQIPDNWRLEQTTDGISASQLMKYRINEAEIHILAEFIECCNGEDLPYKADETLRILSADTTPRAPIHKTHQRRIANGIAAILGGTRPTELKNSLVSGSFMDFYASVPSTEAGLAQQCTAWLDDHIAREKVQTAFVQCEQALSTDQDSTPFLTRLRAILRGLNRWHTSPYG